MIETQATSQQVVSFSDYLHSALIVQSFDNKSFWNEIDPESKGSIAKNAAIRRGAMHGTPGNAELHLLCEAEGAEWGPEWLGQQRGIVYQATGVSPQDIDAMPVSKFAELVQECRASGGDPPREFELNDTEQSIVEAIQRLWGKGLEWPNIDDIAKEAGIETQTAKNNLAPMARHGILEKGPSGRGYKVRT